MTSSTPTPDLPDAPGLTRTTRLNVRAAMLVALAVFSWESAWNFYDSQVPASLREYTNSAALIGLVMGLDNIVGVILGPFVGHLSDRTRTRWGRRTPYLLFGAPVAACFFMLIPFAGSLGSLIVCAFLFSLIASTFEPITDSLTPDFQPPERRSLANGIVKVATSLTIIISALISLFVVDRNLELAFAIPAVMMISAAFIVALTLHEERSPGYRRALADHESDDSEEWTFVGLVLELVRDRDRSRVFLLVAIIVTAGTWAAMRAQLTPYAMEVLDLTRGQAGSLALPAGIAFIAVALPIALVSDRFGRRRMVRMGITVMIGGSLLTFSMPTSTGTMLGVVVVAVGYAAFTINGVVLVWNLAPSVAVTGAYTGVYGVALALGSALGPAAVGGLVDATGWRFLFLDTAVLAVIALVAFRYVLHEVSPAQDAEREAIQ